MACLTVYGFLRLAYGSCLAPVTVELVDILFFCAGQQRRPRGKEKATACFVCLRDASTSSKIGTRVPI